MQPRSYRNAAWQLAHHSDMSLPYATRVSDDDSARLYVQFSAIVRSLVRGVDYDVDEQKKTVSPSESGCMPLGSGRRRLQRCCRSCRTSLTDPP